MLCSLLSARRARCGAFIWLCLLLCAALVACSRSDPKTPLSPELQAVKCPPNQKAHASALFAGARVTFLCIDQKIADTPHLLRCDLESRPMICEDEGSIVHSATADNTIWAGIPRGPQAPDLENGSRLSVYFRKGPPHTSTFDEIETDWRFLTDDGKRFLPKGFTMVKGTLCDRVATVLSEGTCKLEAQSETLYWHISVSALRPKGTSISPEEYRDELEFWLKHLGRLVVAPSK
jgi:hypothetical protein